MEELNKLIIYKQLEESFEMWFNSQGSDISENKNTLHKAFFDGMMEYIKIQQLNQLDFQRQEMNRMIIQAKI